MNIFEIVAARGPQGISLWYQVPGIQIVLVQIQIHTDSSTTVVLALIIRVTFLTTIKYSHRSL